MIIVLAILFLWNLFLQYVASVLVSDIVTDSTSAPGSRWSGLHQPNSFLSMFPWIAVIGTIFMYLLVQTCNAYFLPSYFIFFSALLITIGTDWHTFMISRFVSLFLIPVGVLLSMIGMLPVSPIESIIASIVSYGALRGVSSLFYVITKKDGMGEGDWELFAFTGSFIGLIGNWFTITVGSILGTLFGLGYLLYRGPTSTEKMIIPFGPFLAVASMLFILLNEKLSLLTMLVATF